MTISAHIFHYIRRLAIFILAFLSSSTLHSSVGQEKFDIAHPLHLKWGYEINSGIGFTPATNGETIYVPLKSGNVISLGFKDGEFLWERQNGGRISAAPIADLNTVYVASEIVHPQPQSSIHLATGTLRALSQRNGVTLWTRSIQSPLQGVLTSNETSLFGASAEGVLYAFAKETGEILWTKSHIPPFNISPVLKGKYIYISDDQGNLMILEQTSGKTLSRYRTRGGHINSVVVFDQTIFAGSTGGLVYAIEESTGHLKWRVHTNASVQYVQIAGKCLLVTSLDNYVYCLSPQHGLKLWKRRLAGRTASQPLILNDSVILSPISGEECVVLSLQQGKVINSIFVGEDNITEAAPIFSGNLILLATRKGLFAFSGQSVSAPNRNEAEYVGADVLTTLRKNVGHARE